MAGQTDNSHVWYTKTFDKNCNMLAIYCALLSYSENLPPLNKKSLNKHLFFVFADILYESKKQIDNGVSKQVNL